MMGKPQEKGLIPRSLEQIFQTKQSLESQGWKYEMQVSLLFIAFAILGMILQFPCVTCIVGIYVGNLQ